VSLENARLRYESSCLASDAVAPRKIGTVLPSMRLVDDSPAGPDPDEVRQARLELWQRLPVLHRTTQAKILPRIQDPRLAQAALSWDWGSPCLLMCAPTEKGKTAAAELIALRLMAKGREREHKLWRGIHWVDAPELMSAARAWPLGSGECPEVRRAKQCRLMILDDLGNESDWQTTLFELVQWRYNRQLANIITSGLSLPSIIARHGDAIARRLVDRDGELGTVIDCCEVP
jgi:hypothetical protein